MLTSKEPDQLIKIIKHPDIQQTRVLALALGIHAQRIDKWLKSQISDNGISLITNNKFLKKMDFNKEPLSNQQVAELKDKSKDFARSIDVIEISKLTKESHSCLHMCKKRGAISMRIARKISKAKGIPTCEIRPDIPKLAFDLGLKSWIW